MTESCRIIFKLRSTIKIFSAVILSVNDELEYWKTIADKKDVSKKEREGASAFCDLFEDISEELRYLNHPKFLLMLT